MLVSWGNFQFSLMDSILQRFSLTNELILFDEKFEIVEHNLFKTTGMTDFQRACLGGHIDRMKVLFSEAREGNYDTLEKQCNIGNRPIHFAAIG